MKKIFRFNDAAIEYELERKRVKNINLRIDRQGNVRVSAPRFVPQSAVDSFLAANGARILASRQRLMQRAALMADREDSIVLLGRRMPLATVSGGRNTAQLTTEGVKLMLKDPADEDSRSRALASLVRRLAEERVEDCCRRVQPQFAAMGVSAPEISCRAMKRSWGLCRPSKGQLCFNTALARVPEECVEYVVYHEFCHFIHPDHSPRFHALMSRLLPDWKARKAALENYAPLM